MQEFAHPVELAANRVGGKANLASLLGVSRQLVQSWVERRLPAERVLAVEAATGISRHALRPDIYPVERPVKAARNAPAAKRA